MVTNIVKHKKWWFSISSVLVLLSIISMFLFGFNLGIDYTGGTILELHFEKEVSVSQVREVLKKSDLENSVIQLSNVIDKDSAHDVMVRTQHLDTDQSNKIIEDANSDLGTVEIKRIESVGAVIGSEVTEHALINLAVAFLALIAYISFRFEYKIAISSIVAIIHDLFIVLGIFSFFHLEIDASFLAAILTVIGYSMNETVVIFDRVRENMKLHKKNDTFEDLAVVSIKQSIHRSIYTLATVLFATGSLYFFGGETTKNFSLTMLIGFISGAYSSIFIAISLWVVWRTNTSKRRTLVTAKK